MKSTNHLAVVVAAVLFFALGAVWYTILADPWLAGIGKTVDQLARDGGGKPTVFVDYQSDAQRLIAYRRRVADYHGANPDELEQRVVEGVQLKALWQSLFWRSKLLQRPEGYKPPPRKLRRVK